ncbi:Clcn7, partial [Symbiodinium microadriaticum]
GVFVSCLVSGAVMGRLVGHLLQQHFAEVSDSGTYALVGAAAMIGGVCRNTISLTVMLVESTGNLQYVLPIMLALLSAKYIGDMLTTGLYDRLVILRNLPWLPETLPDMGMVNFCPVSEFMAKPVVFIKHVDRVGNVYETLQTTTHNLFPVLNEDGRLMGAVSRSTLYGMLQACIFSVPMESPGDSRHAAVTLVPVKIQQQYLPPPSTEPFKL